MIARALATVAALAALSGCSGKDNAAANAVSAQKRTVPHLASAPRAPRLMQVYFNTSEGKEWIFAGDGWVPHDATVDAFYAAKDASEASSKATRIAALSAGTFTPTGAHAKHNSVACAVCHLVDGSPCLDPAGPAAAPGKPAPAFDPVTKTCSSVACHGGYSGTFTYTQWNFADDTSQAVTVTYAGTGGGSPPWTASAPAIPSEACATCHGNPPAATTAWHSQGHGAGYAKARRCETCHPDVISALVNGRYAGVAIDEVYARVMATARVKAVHGDGVADVIPRFSSQCFGCH